MNTRIADLPQQKLITQLKQLRTEIAAFKQRQRTSGRSGVLGYVTSNDATWDLTGTIGTDSDTTPVATNFTVKWVGDGTQPEGFCTFNLLFFVNGTDSAHQLTPYTPSWTDGTRTASVSYNETESYDDYQLSVSLTSLKHVTYYIKAVAVGTCRGSLTVTSP